MKQDALLKATSLIAMLLTMLHITDDIVRGISPPGPRLLGNIIGPLIFVVWIVGTLVLTERRTGYVITLLGGLFAAAMPVLHMKGARYASIVTSSGGFFFVWTLYALGTVGSLAMILSARALWQHGRRPPQSV